MLIFGVHIFSYFSQSAENHICFASGQGSFGKFFVFPEFVFVIDFKEMIKEFFWITHSQMI